MRKSSVPYVCDPEWEDTFAQHAWQFKNGYVVRNVQVDGAWRELRMHHVVLGIEPGSLPPGQHVDHLNHNTLDNRAANLRVVSREVNQRYRRGNSTSTSPFKGVSWCNRTRRWLAQSSIGGRKKFIGYYQTQEEAADAYDKYVVTVDPRAYTNRQEEA